MQTRGEVQEAAIGITDMAMVMDSTIITDITTTIIIGEERAREHKEKRGRPAFLLFFSYNEKRRHFLRLTGWVVFENLVDKFFGRGATRFPE